MFLLSDFYFLISVNKNMMNRLKKMDKKVDNIMRIMRKVMKGGKYSNGMFRISLLTKQFARPKIREIKLCFYLLLIFVDGSLNWQIVRFVNKS